MKKPKQIPRPTLTDAKPLTPMQLNNVHFMHPGKLTPVK